MGNNNDILRARAPYNFVPFADQVLIPDEELPGQNVITDELESGEIHITVTAETPLLVSGGNADESNENQNKTFFQDAAGRYAIPGSSVRGMIRENMQILGFGHVRVGEDLDSQEMFYRKIMKNKTYNEKIGKRGRGDPQLVKAGYLEKRNGKFLLWHVVGGSYLKIPKDRIRDIREFSTREIWYAKPEGKEVVISSDFKKAGMMHGQLLLNGMPEGSNKNYFYIFPDPDQKRRPITVSNDDIQLYKQDVDGRKTVVDEDFLAMPDEGESKPFFYISIESNTDNSIDKPKDKHYYFSRSPYPRIPYKYKLEDGLPECHRQLTDQSEVTLDMIHRIMGYAAGQQTEGQQALKSRVSFENLICNQSEPETIALTIATGEPKPTFYMAYTANGKDYNSPDFRLAGYKQYWMKEPNIDELKPSDNEKLNSILHPVKENTSFSGVIRYSNLRKEELGLLLWALRLDENCRQQLGMAKEFGYGRVQLEINQLRNYHPASMYCPAGAFNGPKTTELNEIEQHIEAYQQYASRKLNLDITDTMTIQAFIYMKRTVMPNTQDIRNMELIDFAKVNQPLPTVQEFINGTAYKDDGPYIPSKGRTANSYNPNGKQKGSKTANNSQKPSKPYDRGSGQSQHKEYHEKSAGQGKSQHNSNSFNRNNSRPAYSDKTEPKQESLDELKKRFASMNNQHGTYSSGSPNNKSKKNKKR